MEIQVKNSNKNEYDQIREDDYKLKTNDLIIEPKSFGFHIYSKNIRISVMLVKRNWKRSRKITEHVLKKTFKRKTKYNRSSKSERGNNLIFPKEMKTIDPNQFTGDRKWCWDEFERHIGIPKRSDVNLFQALAYVRAKRCQLHVPEAKNLRKPDDTGTVFLAADKRQRNCLCPDHECLGFNNEIYNETKKIPNYSPNKWNLFRYVNIFKVKKKANIKSFVGKFPNTTKHSSKDETHKNVILNRQLCLSRCRHCLVSEAENDILYLPTFFRGLYRGGYKQEEPDVVEEGEETKGPDRDQRICNIVSCTVSTQTDTTPDGELDISDFSHVIYSNNDKTFLPDIRGKKLQISQYTDVSPKGPDIHELQLCARKMEKFMDFKEMKARLFKFIASIYKIQDPGTPVRTSSTQVPWRQRVCDSFKIRAPNRCGDEDYDNIPEVPWSYKMHDALLDETKKVEWEEDESGDPCPCCELFAGSDIDKETLLDDLRNVLGLPGDEIPMNQLVDDENITIVKNVIEEITANAFDDIDEIIKNEVKFIKVDSISDQTIKQGEDNTEVKTEGTKYTINTPTIDEELQPSLMDAGKASDEIKRRKTGNNKKRVKCDFLKAQKNTLLFSSKTINEKKSELEASKKKSKNNVTNLEINRCNTYIEDDINAIEISSDLNLNKSEDEEKLDLNRDLLKINSNLNKKSSLKNLKILEQQKVASNINNTSKDKTVLRVNTSVKKASSAFSSLFKWLFGQSILMSQIYKNSSSKSVSKEIHSTNDAKLNLRDSKNSEKEVFSIRYTSSNISVNKSTSSGNNK